MDDKELLIAALLWLRNHYYTDTNGNETTKSTVLHYIDAVLADYEPTSAAAAEFRERYSIK